MNKLDELLVILSSQNSQIKQMNGSGISKKMDEPNLSDLLYEWHLHNIAKTIAMRKLDQTEIAELELIIEEEVIENEIDALLSYSALSSEKFAKLIRDKRDV